MEAFRSGSTTPVNLTYRGDEEAIARAKEINLRLGTSSDKLDLEVRVLSIPNEDAILITPVNVRIDSVLPLLNWNEPGRGIGYSPDATYSLERDLERFYREEDNRAFYIYKNPNTMLDLAEEILRRRRR